RNPILRPAIAPLICCAIIRSCAGRPLTRRANENGRILTLEEALKIWEKGEGLGSVYGSTEIADEFNVSQGVYEEPLNTGQYLDPSLTKEYAESVEAE
ncbi:MAG: hypothetical protein ACOC4K_05440, partial [Verrucomicrobiota bacterium]